MRRGSEDHPIERRTALPLRVRRRTPEMGERVLVLGGGLAVWPAQVS